MEDQHLQTFNPSIVSEIKISYQSEVKPHERPKVNSGSEAYKIFRDNWDKSSIELREEFKILLLNRANRVLGILTVSSGGVCSTVVDPKIIFSSALAANASAIILAHNHPSGNLRPSQADIQLTRKIVGAGKLLDISIYDHLIVTYDDYTSFSNEGIL